jgi:hypothetical protein
MRSTPAGRVVKNPGMILEGMMDESTLHEINEVMVDKVSVAFCLALGNICLRAGITFETARVFTHLCGLAVGCQPRDIEAVFYFVDEQSKDPTFMEKHKATEEQVINAMWPGKKNHG